MCPTTDPYSASVGVIAFMHMTQTATGGTQNWWVIPFTSNPTAAAIGRKNYLASAGFFGTVPGFDTRKGYFANRSKFDFRDNKDGTSQTLLFGETVGHKNATSRVLEYSHAWIGSGYIPTAFGLAKTQAQQTSARFSSEHSGTVYFVMGDGAVRGISVDIANTVYQALSGTNDRIPVGDF